MDQIVLGSKHQHVTLAIGTGLVSIAVVVAIHVLLTWWSRRRPRTVQEFSGILTDWVDPPPALSVDQQAGVNPGGYFSLFLGGKVDSISSCCRKRPRGAAGLAHRRGNLDKAWELFAEMPRSEAPSGFRMVGQN